MTEKIDYPGLRGLHSTVDDATDVILTFIALLQRKRSSRYVERRLAGSAARPRSALIKDSAVKLPHPSRVATSFFDHQLTSENLN